MSQLVILGAGGHAKVVADTASLLGYSDICFYDDAFPNKSVLGNTEDFYKKLEQFPAVIVAIGNNQTRFEHTLKILELGGKLISLIHPTAYVSKDVKINAGTVIFAQAVVQPGSSLGYSCIINTAATVDHDCQIENAVHICPGVNIAGEVKINNRTWVGIGSCVRQQVSIGSDVMIGAGSVVVANIPDNQTVIGIPAKPMKDR